MNTPLRWAVLFFPLLTSSGAWADIYKCPVRGKIIYTDRPISQGCVKVPDYVEKSFSGNVYSSGGNEGVNTDMTTLQSSKKQAHKQPVAQSDLESLEGSREEIKQQLRERAAEAQAAELPAPSFQQIKQAVRSRLVVRGMTEPQVRAAWGLPSETETDVTSGAALKHWYFWAPSGIRHFVSFKQGLVHFYL